ncbi:MAG: EF-P lysine aminoacylase GenX, partial [Rhizobiales bacterium]|nr:EF-P lysine aminoacylase GenX [Hyphomicrobiales bacterium]
WQPHIHADRRPLLLARNRIVSGVRQWFEGQEFVEADCGALQVSPGNEAHLHAFATEMIGPDRTRQTRYLHTSPEFACKKLLAAGEARLFSLAKVYRNRERTALHAPEFTMLEWYRAREGYRVVMADCIELLRLAARTVGAGHLRYKDRSVDPFLDPEYLTVAEAFRRHAGVDLLATLDTKGQADRDALARQSPVRIAADDTWSDIFSRILSELVEPQLGLERPTLLYEYPAVEAALARTCGHDPRVAERFELYACGVELANGFGELTDADEQRRRFIDEMALKQRLYGEAYPLDEDFLVALSLMPEASGVALGLDRLVMLATGASRIDQVLWTPAS